MKKLAILMMFCALSVAGFAQTFATFSIITPPCHNDGVITVGLTGLTPPLTVIWTTYGTSGTSIIHTGVSGLSDILTGYSGGLLYVEATGTDTTIHAYGYYGGAPPFSYSTYTTIAVCPAVDTNTVTIDSGGTAPFTYYWYNKASMAFVGSGNPIALPAGDYGVTITDGSGCVFGSTVNPDNIVDTLVAPFYDSITTTPAGCTNGTAFAVPGGIGVGGVPPYTYLWSTGATTDAISGLSMGYYTVTITDADGCKNTAAVYIPQTITIDVPVTPTPATCVASDGAVIAFGSGGVNPYTYVWSNGATTQAQTGLPGGNYQVTATDANGCIGHGGANVSNSTPITATYSTTPSLCTAPTGSATLYLAGGTTPYNIQWGSYPVQTSVTATALTYGEYGFNVTDAAGCKQSGTVYIPPIDVISVSFTAVPALCTLSNGSMTAFPVGGVAPYTYLWSTGATTEGITAKPSGTYTLRITDNLGCVVNKEPYLPYESPLVAGILTTPATCIFNNDGVDAATVWGGTPPYSYFWSSGGTTATISGLPTGNYWFSASDATGCVTPEYYSYVDYNHSATDCYCTISGTVFEDYNNNCVQDAGEPGIPNIQIGVSGSSHSGYTYTDADGNYTYKVPSGTYTVSETVLHFYPLASCQTNNITVTSTAGSGCVIPVNFANSLDTIHDMHISTWSYNNNHPWIGHEYNQVSIVSNDGTVPEDSVVVGYKTDGQLLSPSFVPGSLFSGAPYQYNVPGGTFPTLLPGQTKQLFMNYSVPTNIPMNTTVVFKDTVSYANMMNNWLSDYSPWNNVRYFMDTTVESFDPNFKQVNPQGTGPTGIISYSDSVLEYMVHFQNTGTYMAENITVIDTLDNNLNWTTLRPVFESGKCQVNLAQMGTKHVVTFTFANIDLPAQSIDDLRSNGMLTYTVHLNPDLAVGTQIKNHASIYFDYNAPVVTNSTINTIGTQNPNVGVKNVNAVNSSFTVYPNPAENTFTAVINSATTGNATLQVTDVTGKTLISKIVALQAGSQKIPVDVTKLAPGTYFVRCTGTGITQTQKLVIMK